MSFQRQKEYPEARLPFQGSDSYLPGLNGALNNVTDLQKVSSKNKGTRTKDPQEI